MTSQEQLRSIKEPIIVAFVPIVVGLFAVALGRAINHTICPFFTLTGLPCPGCGGTRAMFSLAHGDIIQAFTYNAFAIFLVAGMTSLWLRWVYRRLSDPAASIMEPKRIYIIVFLVITVAWFIFRIAYSPAAAMI